MGYLHGRVGQIKEIFPAMTEVIDLIDKDTPDTTIILMHVGIIAEPGTVMFINDSKIEIGPSGIWEIANEVAIKSIKFAKATEAQIDYVY